MPSKTGASADRSLRLPLWPIGLFTLWDFYIGGVRPLDHVAAVAIVALFLIQGTRAIDSQSVLKMMLLGTGAWLATFFGDMQSPDAWKSGMGIIEGAIIAVILASAEWETEDLIRFLKAMILLHVAALVLQFAVFHLGGGVINYYAMTGADVRAAIGNEMRPTGLFLEPANFSAMIFMLLVLFRLSGGKLWWLELMGIGTTLMSLSLWGWGSMLLYIVLFRRSWASVLLLPIALGLAYFSTHLTVETAKTAGLVGSLIVRRLAGTGSHDVSAQTRYGGLTHIDITDWHFWFGNGVSDDYEQFGHNGLSFVLSSTGAVGLILALIIMLLIFPPGRRFKGILCFGFMLSAASQWTFLWWWAWIALMSSTNKDSSAAISAASYHTSLLAK
jgi:hypothetical protein